MNQTSSRDASIVSEVSREIERLRAKARHDEAQALHNRSVEIAQMMLADGEPLSKIMRYTGLTQEDLEKIK